jgi:hypothetical protein
MDSFSKHSFLSLLPVNDDFKVLLEFFDSEIDEVAGRVAATIPIQIQEKIARFASGKCAEEEREEMKKLLREQPQLIPTLVNETRALRRPPE